MEREGRGAFKAIGDNYVIKAREENKLRNSSSVTWILNKSGGPIFYLPF